MARWHVGHPRLPLAATVCWSRCCPGAGQKSTESPGRRSEEGWSQGWRTPKSMDPWTSLLPLAALGPICCPHGLLLVKLLTLPFPTSGSLRLLSAPTSLAAQRGASSASSLLPHCTQLLGTHVVALATSPHDLCQSASCATAASGHWSHVIMKNNRCVHMCKCSTLLCTWD